MKFKSYDKIINDSGTCLCCEVERTATVREIKAWPPQEVFVDGRRYFAEDFVPFDNAFDKSEDFKTTNIAIKIRQKE